MADKKFDQKVLDELKAQRDTLDTEFQELSVSLKDQHESDGWDGKRAANKLAVYNRDQLRHRQLRDDLADVKGEIAAMEDLRPDKQKAKPKTWAHDAFRRFALGGGQMLEQNERDIFMANEENLRELVQMYPFLTMGGGEAFMVNDPRILMAAGDPLRSDFDSGDDSAAGLAAPEEWMSGLVERLRYYGAVPSSCYNFSSDNGNDLHFNQMDTATEMGGTITDQSQTAGTGTPPTNHDQIGPVTDIVFKSYIRHSNFMSVRIESLQDLQFDAAGRVMREAFRRMGRGWNAWFTTGTGASQPEGIVTAATVIDGGAGSADDGSGGIDYANVLDMEYAVDLGYLEGNEGGEGGFMDENGGMVGWMMNRNVEKQLREALDSDGRPIWSPDLTMGRVAQGAPGRIGAYPYKINQAMQNGTANDHLPLLFGACGHYGVRNIGGGMFYRFFDSDTVKSFSHRFIGFSRRDGRSIGPTVSGKNEAIAVLQVKT